MDGDGSVETGRKGGNGGRAAVHPPLSHVLDHLRHYDSIDAVLSFIFQRHETGSGVTECQSQQSDWWKGQEMFTRRKKDRSNMLIFQFSMSVIKEHKYRLNHPLLTACSSTNAFGFCFCLDEHLFCSSGRDSAASPESQLIKNNNPTCGLQCREGTKAREPNHGTEVER